VCPLRVGTPGLTLAREEMSSMKMNVVRPVRGSVMALLLLSVLWFLPTTSQAAVLTQLDITGDPASCKAVLISALRLQR
jgi:hypothetical protein